MNHSIPPQGLLKSDFRKWLINFKNEFLKHSSVPYLQMKDKNLIEQLNLFYSAVVAPLGLENAKPHWASFKSLKDEPRFDKVYHHPGWSRFSFLLPQVLDEETMIFSNANDIKIYGFFVPGQAFSEQGDRMGRGKGYYDRYFAREMTSWNGALKVGLAYEEFVFNKLPCETHDVKMDFIVTDKKIRKCIS